MQAPCASPHASHAKAAPCKSRPTQRKPPHAAPRRRTVHEQRHLGRAGPRDALHAQHVAVLRHDSVRHEGVAWACWGGEAGDGGGRMHAGLTMIQQPHPVKAAAPGQTSQPVSPAMRITCAVGESYSASCSASFSQGTSHGVWSKRPTLRVRRSLVMGRPGWDSSASASWRLAVGGRGGKVVRGGPRRALVVRRKQKRVGCGCGSAQNQAANINHPPKHHQPTHQTVEAPAPHPRAAAGRAALARPGRRRLVEQLLVLLAVRVAHPRKPGHGRRPPPRRRLLLRLLLRRRRAPHDALEAGEEAVGGGADGRRVGRRRRRPLL
jgi:hypothetical protein